MHTETKLDPQETISAEELLRANKAMFKIMDYLRGINSLEEEVRGTHYAIQMARVDINNACWELRRALDKLAMLPEEAE